MRRDIRETVALNKFDEILGRLKGLGEKTEAMPTPLVELTMAERVRALRTGYALLQEPITIKPGDIIRGRKELAEAMIRDFDKPHILLEILPHPHPLTLNSENIADSTAAKRYDCIIGYMVSHSQRGGPFFLSYLADIREWELFPGLDDLNKREALL